MRDGNKHWEWTGKGTIERQRNSGGATVEVKQKNRQ